MIKRKEGEMREGGEGSEKRSMGGRRREEEKEGKERERG